MNFQYIGLVSGAYRCSPPGSKKRGAYNGNKEFLVTGTAMSYAPGAVTAFEELIVQVAGLHWFAELQMIDGRRRQCLPFKANGTNFS